jgi:DNA polymerase III psi subunit
MVQDVLLYFWISFRYSYSQISTLAVERIKTISRVDLAEYWTLSHDTAQVLNI